MGRLLLLGVDAGGSKTRVVLGEIVDGRVVRIGGAVGGAGNPRSVGFDSALATIDHTVKRAFDSAGLPVTMVSHACLSVAGAGRPEERQRILDGCASARIAAHAWVVGDAECLLAAVEGCGVALIAGTGSMAWGRGTAGETARAGGCGFLFDDQGSGYWLAAEALRRVCMAGDARRETTSLQEVVLTHLNLSATSDLIAWCYEASDPRCQIATLAPFVFQEYARDGAAQEIVHAGARALAELVHAVARELAFPADGFTLVGAGSVLLHQPIYQRLLESELEQLGTVAKKISFIDNPAEGALQLAYSEVMAPTSKP